MALVTHTHIHWHVSSNCAVRTQWCVPSVSLFLSPPLNMPIKRLLPEAEERLQDLPRPPGYLVSRMLSSARVGRGAWTGDCCFQQQGFPPPHCLFIRDRCPADLWPLTFDSFVCVFVGYVCLCAQRRTVNNAGMKYKLLLKHRKYRHGQK